MNKQEYLLTCLSEECAEIQQAVSKALRFGLDNYNPKDYVINETAIRNELNDLQAIKEILIKENILKAENSGDVEFIKQNKKDKVSKYMKLSIECGTLLIENKQAEKALKEKVGGMIVKITKVDYDSLESWINYIGYENVLQIIPEHIYDETLFVVIFKEEV